MKRYWMASSGIVVGLILLIATLVWSGQRVSANRIGAEQWEAHTRDVLLEAQRALSALQDAETGQRGYIITGRANFLEPYELGRRDVVGSLDRLAALTTDNPLQQSRVGELRDLVAAKLAELAETVTLMQAGDQPGAAAVVMTERGKIVMDQARTIVAAVAAEEQRLLVLRRAETARLDRSFTYELAAIGALTLLCAVIAAGLALEARRRSSNDTIAFEKRLRSLMQRAPAAIAMFDRQMRYMAFSNRFLADYDLDMANGANHLIGRTHYEVFPDIPEHWRAIHRRVLMERAYRPRTMPSLVPTERSTGCDGR